MKKIVYIGHSNLYFGAESIMLRIIFFSKQQRIADPIVLLPISPYDNFSTLLEDKGVNKHKSIHFKLIGASALKSIVCLLFNLIGLIQARIYLKNLKIDYIFTNTSVNIFGAMLAWIMKKPHIWYFHEQPTSSSFKWIPKFLFPLYRYFVSRNSTTIILVSSLQKELWEKEFRIKIPNSRIIYPPPAILPLVEQTHLHQRAPVFGYLGSWEASKNVLGLLRAFLLLKRKHENIKSKLILMGRGLLQEEMKSFILQNRLTEHVELRDHSPETASFYHDIDIFVFPSHFESWGLVVLEALSQRKAVITTQNTALKEVLNNKYDCIFVNPYSDSDIFSAMEQLLLDPALRTEIANNGYETIEKLNLTERFYSSIRTLFR